MSTEEDKAVIAQARERVFDWAGHRYHGNPQSAPTTVTALCDLADRLMRENAELQEWGERCQKVAHDRGVTIDKMHEREHKLRAELARLKNVRDAFLALALEELNR